MQALTGISVPVSIALALAARVPVAFAVLSFVPAIPTLLALVFDALALREFGRIYYTRPRLLDYLRLVLATEDVAPPCPATTLRSAEPPMPA